jgi:hypothetical protein
MFMQHFWRDVYHLSVLFFIDARCQNPKPETQNPKPKTQNPKPKTQNPKPKTQNPKPETQNSELYPKTQEVTYGKSRCYHRPRRRHPAGE